MVKDSIIRFSSGYQSYSEVRRAEIRKQLEEKQLKRLQERDKELKENKR